MDLNTHPIITGYISHNQFGKLLGMDFVIQEKGIVHYFMTVEEKHLATKRVAHGGVLAGLLDAVVGVGALSVFCEELKIVSTVEMKTSFLAPAILGDQLKGISAVVKKGSRLLFMEASIYNQHHELIAKASSTMNAYPLHKIQEDVS